ncbi:glutathione S-transferase 1 [Zeugodacus cucurbitae]|uniref:Glutathione S-transferase 1 n=1 Tax=Zeugodacus cucurbitae TaxID=28588 RepID=A0A0A1X2E4_ZEUCU|nr:glutathione S-transferase 1 [Zeugodacus cucurbitae]WBT60805.1 glutathione S-transferase [Zeugodacus cucurbitae]
MSSKLIIYGTKKSAPTRAVLFTIKALDLDFEFRQVDIFAKEQMQPEFIEKNPQHTVPTLEDAEHIIVDSHAIAAYLVRKYGKDDTLYPEDFYACAVVDHRLYYEASTLFATCLKQITGPLFQQNVTDIPKEKFEQIRNAYTLLETFLSKSAYMAGEHLTIADFSIVSTVSLLNLTFVAIDSNKWPKLADWLKRLEALPYYEDISEAALKEYAELVHSKLPKQYEKLWKKAYEEIKSSRL